MVVPAVEFTITFTARSFGFQLLASPSLSPRALRLGRPAGWLSSLARAQLDFDKTPTAVGCPKVKNG